MEADNLFKVFYCGHFFINNLVLRRVLASRDHLHFDLYIFLLIDYFFVILEHWPVEYFPYFEGKYLAVAASLNGGNALATFISMLQQWTLDLGFNIPQSKFFIMHYVYYIQIYFFKEKIFLLLVILKRRSLFNIGISLTTELLRSLSIHYFYTMKLFDVDSLTIKHCMSKVPF